MADEMKCTNCGVLIATGEEVGLVGRTTNPEDMHVVCMTCHEAQDYSNIPGLNAQTVAYKTAAPMRGAFKPCKSATEILELKSRSYNTPFWVRLEQDLVQMLHELGDKFLRFSLSSRTFEGYKFVFQWEQNQIIGLTFPGSTSTTKPPMNVYQVHRLKVMGLTGLGENPKDWTLQLSGQEASFENVVRILSHVLEFGYMIDVSRIDAITPILDV